MENERLINYLSQRLSLYSLGDFATLPEEILIHILRDALPPPWLLTGTRSILPDPLDVSYTDLRTKLAILSVCKSWNRVGTELLYERVTLRRILQLPVFVRALETREGLGALVRHLDLDCFVPHGYALLYEAETARIAELCPNLVHVGVSPPFWIPGLPSPLAAMSSSNITSLEYSSSVPYSAILPTLVALSPTLQSLVLTLPAAQPSEHPLLIFPKLAGLSVHLNSDSSVPASTWRIPALRHLALSLNHFDRAGSGAADVKLLALLDAYGATLTSLRLPRTLPAFDLQPHLQPVLDRCPRLAHLTMHDVPPTGAALHHPRLQFIDVFCTARAQCRSARLFKEAFPALRSYRNLAAMASVFRELPGPSEHEMRVAQAEDDAEAEAEEEGDADPGLDDDDDNDEGNFLASLPGMAEFVDARAVHGLPTDNLGEFDWGQADISPRGSNYGSSDEEESDSSDSDASTVSEELVDMIEGMRPAGEEWEMDREEAIALFYATREG
ncbi:hypothetical protein C8R46DRAFT_342911 [Mycena filopes]|nr:hypothetical protein C8R46DRAFT_342911 [Mycena filopes]